MTNTNTVQEAAMNTAFTIVRDETPSANLIGSEPCPIARNLNLDAHLLERITDGAHFLLIGATTDEGQARRWAEEWIADQAEAADQAEHAERLKEATERAEALGTLLWLRNRLADEDGLSFDPESIATVAQLVELVRADGITINDAVGGMEAGLVITPTTAEVYVTVPWDGDSLPWIALDLLTGKITFNRY